MTIKHKQGLTVAAHRGDSYNFYENTMKAFELAIENGADMIETDVRLTKDNVLVLCHDESLKRTGRVDVKIADLTYDELQNYNVGDVNNFAAVPKLEELLVLLKEKDIMLNLEIKEYYEDGNIDRCNYCIEKCVEMIEKYKIADNMVFNSFDAYVLEYIHKKYPGKYMLHGFYPYSIMKNVQMNPDEYLYCACVFGDKIKENYDYLASKSIEAWIGAGVTVTENLKLCIEYGAKLITTNNPADVLKKLEKGGMRK